MNPLRTLSEDKITGQIAPVGHITGFPQPHIRSPWPDNPRLKPLTDRRIAKYAKQGKYALQAEARAEKKQKAKRKKLPDFI